jgi:hypothetical protein
LLAVLSLSSEPGEETTPGYVWNYDGR